MNAESGVDIRRREHDDLSRAHGLDLKLLWPWRDLAAPFHGAWCVLRPGDISDPHSHAEHEIFIGMAGRAEVLADGRRQSFAAGDLALISPGVVHQVANVHDEDFAYYAIWWEQS